MPGKSAIYSRYLFFTEIVFGIAFTGLAQAGGHGAEQIAVAKYGEPGMTFLDCQACPEMMTIPAGQFQMGSSKGGHDEMPKHRVEFQNAFAIGKYEVTFAQWGACVAGGGCDGYRPHDEGWGRGARPVMNVGWQDA